MAQQPGRAVVLCSGGVDSTTVMAIAKNQGYEIYSLSFSYGQRHAVELEAAKKVSARFEAREHLLLSIDLWKIGGSALTGAVQVPKDRSPDAMAHGIPITYVPARNTIFLSYALAWAEVLGAGDIFIGINALDYSGYPDCRPEYLQAFQNMANLATRAGVEAATKTVIHAPLLHMTKAEIIRTGIGLGVDYGMTFSCYDPLPDGTPCLRCDSCILRRKGFDEAGAGCSS